MQKKKLKAVLEKIQSGDYTPDEEAIAKYWLHHLHHKESTRYTEPELDNISNNMWLNILAERAVPKAKIKKLWSLIAVAASVAVVIGLGIWFYQSSTLFGNKHMYAAAKIFSGTNKATITLANGKIINLSNTKTGVVIDATQLTYSDGTRIGNSGNDHRGTKEIKVATPRGGTYQVQLPDGTRVWLNAATNLSYSIFLRNGDKVRKVKLDGEAYFEVAKVMIKAQRMPFVVESKNQQVEVLGTHFNINNYPDEQGIKTTLLEGSVVVSAFPSLLGPNSLDEERQNDQKVETVLKPGEQALLKNAADLRKYKVDVEQVVDWKNGVFIFRDEKLGSIMRKISRWYDVDIDYSNDAPLDATFGGYVSRSRSLFTVLERMEKTGQVKFVVKGRHITVLSNNENE